MGGLTYRNVYGLEKVNTVITGIPNGAGSVMQGDIVKLWYHQNRLGSTDFLTDNVQGKVTSLVSYDDWGAPTMKAILRMGVRELDLVTAYTGHPMDAVLGVYFAEARMYDASDRRFMAEDWVKGNAFEIIALNSYVYVLDNPLVYVDYQGLTPQIPLKYPSGTSRIMPDSLGSIALDDISMVETAIATVSTESNFKQQDYLRQMQDDLEWCRSAVRKIAMHTNYEKASKAVLETAASITGITNAEVMAYMYTELVVTHKYSKDDAMGLAFLEAAIHEYAQADAHKSVGWMSNVNMDMHNNRLGLEIAEKMVDNEYYRTGIFGIQFKNDPDRYADLTVTILEAILDGEGVRNNFINYDNDLRVEQFNDSWTFEPTANVERKGLAGLGTTDEIYNWIKWYFSE